MVHDIEQIRQILASTSLGGLDMASSPLARSAHHRFDIALIDYPGDVLDAWQAARSVLAETGRWPLVLDTELAWDSIPHTWAGDGPELGQHIIRQVEELDPETLVDQFLELDDYAMRLVDDHDIEQRDLKDTAAEFGEAPTVAEVRKGLGSQATAIGVERWLHRWENERGAVAPRFWAGAERYFTQNRRSLVLSLLPVSEGWQVPSLLDFAEHGGDAHSDGHEELASWMRRWTLLHQAELWGFSCVDLFFKLPQPVQHEDAAWSLVLEHEAVAGDGHWAFGDYSYRRDVRDLLSSDRWALGYKP